MSENMKYLVKVTGEETNDKSKFDKTVFETFDWKEAIQKIVSINIERSWMSGLAYIKFELAKRYD